jgi:hypothetical protein
MHVTDDLHRSVLMQLCANQRGIVHVTPPSSLLYKSASRLHVSTAGQYIPAGQCSAKTSQSIVFAVSQMTVRIAPRWQMVVVVTTVCSAQSPRRAQGASRKFHKEETLLSADDAVRAKRMQLYIQSSTRSKARPLERST